MNKLLLAAIALGAGLSAFAQGTVNVNNNYIPAGGTVKTLVVDALNVAVPIASGRVEVLDSTGGIISTVKDGTGNLFSGPGLFLLGTTVVPNIPAGGSGQITIRAWDVNSGSTYALAGAKASTTVTISGLGGGLVTPPTLNTATGGADLHLVLVPEPSTIALAAFGLAGLFFVARRK